MIIRAATVSVWMWLVFAYLLTGQVFAGMTAILATGLSVVVWILETEL